MMTHHPVMTEEEYRRLGYNSSSSLKDFSIDRKKYHKKYILGEVIKEEPNKSANMGRLVETLLMEPEKFDDYFFMSSLVSVPSGKLGTFIYTLSELIAEADTGEDVVIDEEKFEELAREAYKKAEYKVKFDTVIGYLDDPNNKLYYEECMKVNYSKMTMVTVQDIDNAERIVAELKTNPVTSTIVNLETDSRFEVINQMKIEDYVIDGMRLKSMLDKVIIDHNLKVVKIYDLKCTWSVEGFYREYYLYRRTYIQAYLYYNAVKFLTTIPDSSVYGYEVEYPEFIVCDSINYYKPLIYTLSEQDMVDAYHGFTVKERKYPGVKQIIEDLLWASDNDEWRISKTNADKNGRLNIKD